MEGLERASSEHDIRGWFALLSLQCNELNWGHPTFFYQSQDEFRTKDSQFVHCGPITNEGLTAKSLFPSTKSQLNNLHKGATKNVGWPQLSSLHCNSFFLIFKLGFDKCLSTLISV